MITDEQKAREYGWRCGQALQTFNARRTFSTVSEGELQLLAHLAWAYAKLAWHHAERVEVQP
jgi:hypothetical protein